MKTKPGLFSLLAKLGKDKRASGPRLLARLIRDEEGSYLLYALLILPVLIGVGGLAGEASLLLYNHRTLQSAADAAAFSTAIAYSNNLNLTALQLAPQAQAIVASYGFTNFGTGPNQTNVNTPVITGPPYPSGAKNNNIAITVSIQRPQSAIFSIFSGFASYPNNVGATAVINGGGGSSFGAGNCLLALGNTTTSPPANAADAIQVQGGGGVINVNAPNCGIFTNSNDCTNGSFSIALGGNAKIVAGSLGAAGCVAVGGNSSITLPTGATYSQNDGAISDPYAATKLPSSGPCLPTPAPVNNTVTLPPGRYCNGINANGVNFNLTGGVYILDCSASTCPTVGIPQQGQQPTQLIVKGATVSDGTTSSTLGAGVTLVFTCSTCSASQWPGAGFFVDSNGTLLLSAPSSGSTAGFLMMGDPNMPLNTLFYTWSNPTVIANGTVWVPDGKFRWNGTPSSSGGSSCLQMVVNTITLYGNSGLSGGGCSLSPSGGSSGAGKPVGSVVTLVD